MFYLRPLAALCAVVSMLLLGASCSTVSSRIKDRAAAFRQLPPDQQVLVEKGKIRVGFGADAVYLAWGKPDFIKHSIAQGKLTETWTYIGYQEETYEHFDVIPEGVGRHGFAPQIISTPVYENQPYIRRQVAFADGKVVAWNEGQLP